MEQAATVYWFPHSLVRSPDRSPLRGERKSFATVTAAVRFAIEDLPLADRAGAFLVAAAVIDDETMGRYLVFDQIAALYSTAEALPVVASVD